MKKKKRWPEHSFSPLGMKNIVIILKSSIYPSSTISLSLPLRGKQWTDYVKSFHFTKIVIPRNNYEAVKDTKGIEIWPVDNLRQAINIVLGGNKE